jgi:hypothetical protein
MEEPLVSEDSDLTRLLAGIREQQGDSAEILYQDSVRRGGVLGFFAHEVYRVAYRVRPAPAAEAVTDTLLTTEPVIHAQPTPNAVDVMGVLSDILDQLSDTNLSPIMSQPVDNGLTTEATLLDALIADVEQVEAAGPVNDTVRSNDFARMLHELAEEPEPEALAEVHVPEPDRRTTGQSESAGATVTQINGRSARDRLDLLMQLREVGVPVAINPKGEAHSIYEAMEEILAELPPAPSAPRNPGEVLALVGDLTSAVRTAYSVAAQLRIPQTEVWIAGLSAHPAADLLGSADPARTVTGVRHAARLRAELRTHDLPSIVVIATDSIEAEPADPWAAEVLQALQPTASWLIVDATVKPEDNRARLARIAPVDALAVHSAQLSTSPATVWDLGLPVALLDGRPASTFAWAGLLFGALRPASRQSSHHHASA